MREIINEIGTFVFVEDTPKRSDIIIAVGGSYPQIPETCASLYHTGFAPYVLATGKYGFSRERFNGVSDKAEIYNGTYETECDFYVDVLQRHNVPDAAILKENQSRFTRENAEFARKIADAHGLTVRSILVVCKRFHARRCQMLFASAFPEAEIRIVPADICTGEADITKDNWYKTEKGVKRVLGELSRCGNQVGFEDIEKFLREK